MRTKYQLYTRTLDELQTNIDHMKENGVLDQKRVLLFGSNDVMNTIAYYLRSIGIEPEAIIDNDKAKQGKRLYDLPIVAPEEKIAKYDDDFRILLASSANIAMIEQMREYGYRLGRHVFVVIDYEPAGHDYHFLDRSGYTRITFEEQKKAWVAMLKKMDEVCSENDITYFLADGSMLGAVRHKGFIPWDDDVDIFVPFNDLEKLTRAFEKEEDFSVHSIFSNDVNYLEVMAVFSDDRYLCDMYRIPQLTCGLPIDILPLIGMPEDEKDREAYLGEIKSLEAAVMNSFKDEKKQTEYKEKLKEAITRYDYRKMPYVLECYSGFSIKSLVDSALFADCVYEAFEDIRVRIPSGYDGYLHAVFGDYMKFPPKEQQVLAHEHQIYRQK